ncbi:Dihydropyrimidinase [Striga hermonthica]|uniref:dihydropyrimidinase n=1 Tax=Striga hermonthica TaxID=68872 RepID=A0A9N7NMK5_STRHE|nr:Dihydropyrimidinase [Striga hermonthica]
MDFCFAPRNCYLYLTIIFLSLFSPLSECNQFCDAGIAYGESVCGAGPAYLSKILIKGGTVVNAHHQEIDDVYIEDGIIVAVQNNIVVGDDVKIIDATGKYDMPGGIDPHTHLAMEFMRTKTIDDFFSGQAAALAGGTTMHIDFFIPVNGSLSTGLESYVKKAERLITDYGFHMAITKWDETVSREMEVMVKDKDIMQLEGEATGRAIRLAGFVNTFLYVVHVMSIDAMEEIAKARKSGSALPILAGYISLPAVASHILYYTLFVMSPPIRAPGHGKALQAALSTGILQLVGTDHCTFNSTQKEMGIDDFRKIPNGVNGLEERMHLVWDTMVVSGQISVADYVMVTITECAKIFNIYPRKGAILAGSDADIIILNPDASFEISSATHHSQTDTNVYEGRRRKGKVEVTIAGGQVVWEDNELKVVPGSGKYIEMPPFSYLFDGIEKTNAEYYSSLRAPVKRGSHTS